MVRDGFGVPVPPVRRAIRGEVWSLTLLLVSVGSSEPIGRRSPAEHRLEVAAFGVLAPKQFGHMGGLVLLTRAEGSDYRGVRDVDALARQCFVEHPCVGHFRGVRDHGARAVRARGDGGPPVVNSRVPPPRSRMLGSTVWTASMAPRTLSST